MKYIILILLLLITTVNGFSLKIDLPFTYLTFQSKLIVVGEISEIQDSTYTFKISETIKGSKYNSIEVLKFKEWTCDERRYGYEIGQKLCLFLDSNKDKWEIINGSTGEKFIIQDSIYVSDYFEIFNQKYKYWPKAQLISDFASIMKEYSLYFNQVRNSNQTYYIQSCSQKVINKLKKRSKFSLWFYNELKKQGIKIESKVP
jgi:hypothetical protein